jgi:hypothetical protein
MISFDDLKQKFAVLPVEDLGDCIVIPGEQLDLDWILMFLEVCPVCKKETRHYTKDTHESPVSKTRRILV